MIEGARLPPLRQLRLTRETRHLKPPTPQVSAIRLRNVESLVEPPHPVNTKHKRTTKGQALSTNLKNRRDRRLGQSGSNGKRGKSLSIEAELRIGRARRFWAESPKRSHLGHANTAKRPINNNACPFLEGVRSRCRSSGSRGWQGRRCATRFARRKRRPVSASTRIWIRS